MDGDDEPHAVAPGHIEHLAGRTNERSPREILLIAKLPAPPSSAGRRPAPLPIPLELHCDRAGSACRRPPPGGAILATVVRFTDSK
jgi:hypothetical protein